MRAFALCSLCVFSLASEPDTAAAEPVFRRDLELSAGVSIAGTTFRGLHLAGSGPYAALEVRAGESLSVEVDYRRHVLRELAVDAQSTESAAATARMVTVLLRHSLFELRGRRYVDLHAGLGSERLELEGERACTRRTIAAGVTLLQPGSMYHVSDHLELRFGIGVLVSRAAYAPGPVDCTGPCSSATAGRSHDIGFLGTFAIGVR